MGSEEVMGSNILLQASSVLEQIIMVGFGANPPINAGFRVPENLEEVWLSGLVTLPTMYGVPSTALLREN